MSENTITITAEKVADTKNTRRFAEVVADGQTAKVGTVYVQNADLAILDNPERITVTLAKA